MTKYTLEPKTYLRTSMLSLGLKHGLYTTGEKGIITSVAQKF